MKVNVGVVGRFHAFDLAQQLQKHHVLNKFITTYPRVKTREWMLDDKSVKTEVLLEIVNRLRRRIPLINPHTINYFVKKLHARQCSKYLAECDIHIGWSGSSLETIIQSKSLGKITILERGSSHYSYQSAILSAERRECNLRMPNLNYLQWQRELLEYELADYISVPSNFVKRSFIDKGFNPKKLILNPYGVNLSDFKKVTKNDSKFRIIFTGHGSLRKGYHYLLKAFYELNLPNAELWHLGKVNFEEVGPYLKKYKTDNWHLKGHVPQKELYRYYSQGDVFVLPSIEEGFAMVQFQAMACGLPLICTTNTGGEDLIAKDGKSGFVIPIRNVDELKDKIRYLYDNRKTCIEMGKIAQKTVQNGFTWDDYGERYVNNLRMIYGKHEF